MRKETLALCALLAAATAGEALYAAGRLQTPAEAIVSDVPIAESAPATPADVAPPRFIYDEPLAEQPRAAAEIPADPPIAVRATRESDAQAAESPPPAERESSPASEQAPSPSEAEAVSEPVSETVSVPSAANLDALLAETLDRLAAIEIQLADDVDALAQEILAQCAGGDTAQLAAAAARSLPQLDALEAQADAQAEAALAPLSDALTAAGASLTAVRDARASFAAAKQAQLGYWRSLAQSGAEKVD